MCAALKTAVGPASAGEGCAVEQDRRRGLGVAKGEEVPGV